MNNDPDYLVLHGLITGLPFQVSRLKQLMKNWLHAGYYETFNLARNKINTFTGKKIQVFGIDSLGGAIHGTVKKNKVYTDESLNERKFGKHRDQDFFPNQGETMKYHQLQVRLSSSRTEYVLKSINIKNEGSAGNSFAQMDAINVNLAEEYQEEIFLLLEKQKMSILCRYYT